MFRVSRIASHAHDRVFVYLMVFWQLVGREEPVLFSITYWRKEAAFGNQQGSRAYYLRKGVVKEYLLLVMNYDTKYLQNCQKHAAWNPRYRGEKSL